METIVKTYQVEGMTCQNCQSSVQKKIAQMDGVSSVKVDLDSKKADIEMTSNVTLKSLQQALSPKYEIQELKKNEAYNTLIEEEVQKSKLSQLKPLFLILFYIAVASFLMHKDDLVAGEIMLDFMGLFFIVFSFFKMLDLKGFSVTFAMYDPIAKVLPFYALLYPFLETALGLMFLFRFSVNAALIATIVILGFTTIGVTKTLLSKMKIKCACLGTALNLPMTEATFIENALMIIMSSFMLFL